jgi:hypothetical protein
MKTGDLVKVAIPKGRGAVVDLQNPLGGCKASIRAFADGKPRTDPELLGWSFGARRHWIIAFPQGGPPPPTEVVVHVDDGSALARIIDVPLDDQGKVGFPKDLALGEEPLRTFMNCGPEEVYEYERKIDSARAAIDLVKEVYLEKNTPIHEMDTCRLVGKRGPNEPHQAGDIDWARLVNNVRQCTVGRRTIYELRYSVQGCGGESYRLRVSSDGWLSHYGCCGV